MMAGYDAFGDMELSGWSDATRAAAYVDLFAQASDQAIPALLESVEATRDLKVLDLCCGQGNVSAALVALGCEVVGADFSPAMIALAEARVAGARFVEADAQDLPFEDNRFDAVISNFGICHVPDQPRALKQVRRVLRDGGRFGMTVWCGPDTSAAFATLYGAVKLHGDPQVSVPDGPDFHQFARADIADALLGDAGFANMEHRQVDCRWDLPSPDGLARIYESATVRAAALLLSQPAAHRAAIYDSMEATVREKFAHGDRWQVPVPAALSTAQKA